MTYTYDVHTCCELDKFVVRILFVSTVNLLQVDMYSYIHLHVHVARSCICDKICMILHFVLSTFDFYSRPLFGSVFFWRSFCFSRLCTLLKKSEYVSFQSIATIFFGAAAAYNAFRVNICLFVFVEFFFNFYAMTTVLGLVVFLCIIKV